MLSSKRKRISRVRQTVVSCGYGILLGAFRLNVIEISMALREGISSSDGSEAQVIVLSGEGLIGMEE